MIQVDNLTRRFHDLLAVDDVSFSVEPGEVFGFLGPNGAGKSTTIRVLTGFLPATSGRARVADLDVASQGLAVRRQIGYLPEQIAVPADARVHEYLDYRGRLKGLGKRDREARKQAVLGQCGLEAMRTRMLGQLSRGYRQRVGLADALLADPPVLILDEPTGGLDPAQRQDVLDLIGSLRGHRTVLISSHVLAEIEGLCSRVTIIREGRVVASGTRDELREEVGRAGEYLIGTAGPPEVLERALAQRQLSSHAGPEQGRLLTLPADCKPAELLAELVREGLPIDRFERRERTLQEIFLELVAT